MPQPLFQMELSKEAICTRRGCQLIKQIASDVGVSVFVAMPRQGRAEDTAVHHLGPMLAAHVFSSGVRAGPPLLKVIRAVVVPPAVAMEPPAGAAAGASDELQEATGQHETVELRCTARGCHCTTVQQIVYMSSQPTVLVVAAKRFEVTQHANSTQPGARKVLTHADECCADTRGGDHDGTSYWVTAVHRYLAQL